MLDRLCDRQSFEEFIAATDLKFNEFTEHIDEGRNVMYPTSEKDLINWY